MALRELIASFGIEVDDAGLEKASSSLDGFLGKLRAVAEGAIAYKVTSFFVGLTRSAADQADELAKSAQKIGVNALELQKWQYAADLAGVSAETLSGSMGILARNAEAAASGGKEQSAAFQKLGVNIKDAAGNLKDPATLLGELATGFDGVENATEKTALSMAVLGRGGKELLPLFNGGAAAIEKTRAELEGLGAAFDQDFLDQSEEANDNISRFHYSLDGLRNIIAKSVLPILNKVVLWATDIVKKFQGVIANTNAIKAAFVILGAMAVKVGIGIVTAFAPVIASVLLFTGIIAAAYLLVEDFLTFLDGGESLIGDFIDALAGKGASLEFLTWLKDYWGNLLIVIDSVTDAIKAVLKFTNGFDAKVLGTLKTVRNFGKGVDAKIIGEVKDFGAFLGIGDGATKPGNSQPYDMRNDAKSFNTLTERSVPAPAGAGVTNIAPQSTQNLTINAPNADAKEVVKIAERTYKEQQAKDYDSAFSALVQSKGTP